MIDAVFRNGVIRDVAGLARVLAATEPQFRKLLVLPLTLCFVSRQLPVALLDVAHRQARVPHRRPLHLVGNVSPLGMQQFQLRHHHTGDVPPRCRYARLQNLNRQVVGPAAGFQPGGYHGLLLLVRVDPDPARLPLGSVGVRASGN